MRALLALAADTGASCGEVDERASRQLTEVDRKIADLRAPRRELSAVVDSCASSTVGERRVLEAFSSGRVEGAGTTA